jgi:hypothetical protein
MNNKMRLLILAICFPWNSSGATEITLVLQQGTKGYTGTRDVTISSDGRMQDQNFGGAHQIGVWQFDGVLLIRFDLSSLPRIAVIKTASLELAHISAAFTNEEIARAWPIHVYECTHEWKEGSGIPKVRPKKDGATLKTYDGIHPWPGGKVTSVAGKLLGTTIHEGNQRRPYKWDLKPDAIQAWVSGSRSNYGFMVWGKPPGKAVDFTAKDSTAVELRPILRLTLSLPDADVVKLGGLAASDITWPQFLSDCGREAQKANEARSEQVFDQKYAGRTVNWTGIVDSIRRKPIGSGYFVDVLMDPTQSNFGLYDLTLSAPDNMTEKVLSLNKGQKVEFMGRFSRQGGVILGHQLDLMSIGTAKAVAQPQPKDSSKRKGRR